MSVTGGNVPGVSVDVTDLIDIRSRLSGLSLNRIRLAASQGIGVRRRRIRGRGMEYEESRIYMPGDDVRTMDWRVMARTGEAHTKVFGEEKERSILLVVDLSASMYFGTRYALKSWAATQVAAHIGWLATSAGDRLGGLVVSTDAHYEIRPARGQAGLMRLFQHLATETNVELPVAPQPSRLDFLLRELRGVVKTGSFVVLISDFLGIGPDTPELMSSVIRHNDMMMCWIHDGTETRFWPIGSYQVILDGRQVPMDLTTPPYAKWLDQRQRTHRSQVEGLASRFKIPLCPLSCNQDVARQISGYLKK